MCSTSCLQNGETNIYNNIMYDFVIIGNDLHIGSKRRHFHYHTHHSTRFDSFIVSMGYFTFNEICKTEIKQNLWYLDVCEPEQCIGICYI